MSPLLGALRRQASKDHTCERMEMFALYLQQRPLARIAYRTAELAPNSARIFLLLLFGCLQGKRRLPSCRQQPLALGRFPNELSAIKKVRHILIDFNFQTVFWNQSATARLLSAAYFSRSIFTSMHKLKQTAAILARLNRRFPFFVALRAAETLFTYLYLRKEFECAKPTALLLSTEGNPHATGSWAAAEALGIPVIFLSHAGISSNPVPIRAALGIFYGEIAAEEYLRAGSRIDSLVQHGWKDTRENFRPAARPQKVAIFLSKDPHPARLETLIEKLSGSLRASEILVRLHPQTLVPRASLAKGLAGKATLSGGSLEQDLRETSLVLAGNSTVHLECWLRQVPSVYWPELDSAEHEKLTFLKEDLIPLFEPELLLADTVREVGAHFALPHVHSKLKRYLDIDRSEQEFQASLRAALQRTLPCPPSL